MPETADQTRLEAIEARANAATPGPWQWWNLEWVDQGWSDNGPTLETVERNPGSEFAKTSVVSGWGYDAYGTDVEKPDAEFIAAARSDVPWLIDRIRAQEAALTSVRAATYDLKYGHDIEWVRGNIRGALNQLDRTLTPTEGEKTT